MLHCNRWSIGRSSAHVYVCASSPSAPNKKREKGEQAKEIHACMKARRHLIINSSMPLGELG